MHCGIHSCEDVTPDREKLEREVYYAEASRFGDCSGIRMRSLNVCGVSPATSITRFYGVYFLENVAFGCIWLS
jgi:hypothetical protein